MIMKITKMLGLATFVALSVGATAAMAQSEVPAGAGNGYSGAGAAPAPQVTKYTAHRAQAGASDVDRSSPGNSHILPFNSDYSDLANPG
jgi:hypothetical protein